MNRFIAKTIHLTRNRTRRNDESIESTWSSHSLSFFLFSTEKTRIRNKDGLGWIIETSFYATRTIHHANCISCGDRQVISKKRINLLELQLVKFHHHFFFLQNFLTFFISSLAMRSRLSWWFHFVDRETVSKTNEFNTNEISFGSKFEMFIHVCRYSTIIIMSFNKKKYVCINETFAHGFLEARSANTSMRNTQTRLCE